MKATRFFSAKNVAYLAVLLALVIVLQVFASMIPVGGAQLNFSLIPIVLGAILLGPAGGAFLGFACGVVVLIQVIALPSVPFYAVIWTYSPVVTTLTCLVKTTVAGLAAGIFFRALAKKNSLAAVFTASAVVPVLNTALFILGCLCMSGAISGHMEMNGMNIFVFILVALVTFNFFIELGLNLVIAPAVHRVVLLVEGGFTGAKKRASQELAPGPGDDGTAQEQERKDSEHDHLH